MDLFLYHFSACFPLFPAILYTLFAMAPLPPSAYLFLFLSLFSALALLSGPLHYENSVSIPVPPALNSSHEAKRVFDFLSSTDSLALSPFFHSFQLLESLSPSPDSHQRRILIRESIPLPYPFSALNVSIPIEFPVSSSVHFPSQTIRHSLVASLGLVRQTAVFQVSAVEKERKSVDQEWNQNRLENSEQNENEQATQKEKEEKEETKLTEQTPASASPSATESSSANEILVSERIEGSVSWLFRPFVLSQLDHAHSHLLNALKDKFEAEWAVQAHKSNQVEKNAENLIDLNSDVNEHAKPSEITEEAAN